MAGDITISFEEFKSNLEAVFNSVINEHKPVTIENGAGEMAVLMPANRVRRRRKPPNRSEKDREAFLATAGGWKGLVDTDKLKRDIDESRSIRSRPPIEL